MAITFEKLQELLKQQKFHFFVASDQPVLRAGVQGLYGRYEFVIHLQDEGQFLQFRTMSYLACPAGSPHLLATLRAIAHINYIRRSTKFAWDPSDGEIVAYADTFLMDNDLTADQLARIMGNYLPTIDVAYARLRPTIETGNDPGDPDPQELMRRVEEARKQPGPEPGPNASPTPSGDSSARPPGDRTTRPTPAEPPIKEI